MQIKRVSYSYNSNLDSTTPYQLEVYVQDGQHVLVDFSESYGTREELFEAMEGVIPIFPQVEEFEGEGAVQFLERLYA